MLQETEDLALDEATVTRGVHAILSGTAAGAYYVAAVNNEVVGSLMITYEWSDWRALQLWWIQSVYVRPDCRKNGHFKALYAYVRSEAVAAGAAGLRLYADDSNANAHATYQRLGMSSHYKVMLYIRWNA